MSKYRCTRCLEILYPSISELGTFKHSECTCGLHGHTTTGMVAIGNNYVVAKSFYDLSLRGISKDMEPLSLYQFGGVYEYTLHPVLRTLSAPV